MGETIELTLPAGDYTTDQPTPMLRWYLPAPLEPRVLQQAWSITTHTKLGSPLGQYIEWRELPFASWDKP